MMSKLSDDAVARLTRTLVVPALPDRYDAIEVIGRGGMGVVWRARDRLLERDVAIKVLAEHANGDGLAVRLRREARILARLEHPGIVAVHDTGTLPDGRAWYAMRLVLGERLDAAASELASIGDAIRVVMRIAETVAYAHAAGIVHRDLTPRNVMLGPFGEVLILDWGVARDVARPEIAEKSAGASPGDDADSAAASGSGAAVAPTSAPHTAHGTILGTPGYIPPERAAGLRADERSDVYGLGAILHGVLEALRQPIPKPLAAIRDKARAREPGDRYPDVPSFHDDLARFQDGRPVSAYREGILDRARRVWRQHRTPILPRSTARRSREWEDPMRIVRLTCLFLAIPAALAAQDHATARPRSSPDTAAWTRRWSRGSGTRLSPSTREAKSSSTCCGSHMRVRR